MVKLIARVVDDADGEPTFDVSVVDTGCGLNEHQISGLFRPFSQADTSVTRSFGGTGLGLTICQRLVHLMDGRIDVESVFAKGSRFTLSLPLGSLDGVPMVETPHEIQETGADPPGPPTKMLSGQILLAEDGPDN